uniref:Uncharacterized protein n=1 Tax=Kwoniella pini CBS 10737 TaxID=1296096 RepID=A0A1B9HTL1_9TREE|nr:uncharacterized protein I206_07457 [Kwoniella pini CBS 10737]OCF46604.1 hypothetical protein I206_07457 [Kwoniella pini CBS 10737]
MSSLSLSQSMLGLTDSPLRPRLRSTLASTPVSSAPSSPIQKRPSQPHLRHTVSRNSLVQEATNNAARKVVQQNSSETGRTAPSMSSQSQLSRSESPNGTRSSSRASTASTGRSIPVTPVAANLRSTQPIDISPVHSVTPTAAQRQANRSPQSSQTRTAQAQTQSRPRSAAQRRPDATGINPPSPARTEITLAEEWESELIKDTRNLNIRPAAPAVKPTRHGPTAKEREEQRLKDIEWERSGMWENARDPAREAEDRVRRDIGRDVAYPPATPRVPIRAAPTGPDPLMSLPLFSPASASANLGGSQSSPAQSQIKYDHKLAEKARREYEDWKARKAEREGGMGEGAEDHGTREWVPQTREVARPGNDVPKVRQVKQRQQLNQKQQTETQPQTNGTPNKAKSPAMEKLDPADSQEYSQAQCWGYPYPYGMGYDGSQMQGMEGYYPDQAYWDPSYWWNMSTVGDPQQMAMMQYNHPEGRKVQFADPHPDGSPLQGDSAPVTLDNSYGEM